MVNFAGDALQPSERFGVAPRFGIEVKAELLASFAECSGLSVSVRNDKWEEGGANHTTLKFPGRTDFGNLTLRHGVTHSEDLFKWFLEVLRGEDARRNITVILFGHDLQQQLRSWQFSRAFPVKWTGPTLQAASSTVAIESVEFAHDGFVTV